MSATARARRSRERRRVAGWVVGTLSLVMLATAPAWGWAIAQVVA